MKTFSKSLALLLALTLITLGLAACSNNDSASKVSGKTFAFESCTMDGEDATETITAMYKEQSFSFKEDGTCVQTIVWTDEFAEMMGSSDPVEQSGSYEESGNTVKLTFTSDDEDVVMEFTIDGDTLTMTEDGSVMVYKLQTNS